VQVRRAGLTPAQHQLLLAIRGAERDGEGPTIGEVADHLFRRHNTVVGLVDRAVDAGLVERHHVDRGDRRMVRLSLTEEGCSRLAALAGLHLEELERLRSLFEAIPGAAEDDEQG
jgi:DNA-binding MarR family transcriptional regulator